MGPIIDVLSNKLFRKLWMAQIASQFAGNMLLFLLALVMYQKTQSNAIVSGLFLAYGMPSLFFGMIAGVIVDRLDRRTVLILAHVTRACFMVLLLLFSLNIATMYLLVFFNAIVTQFTTPSEVPLIPRFVPKEKIVTANSLFSVSFYSAMAVGFITAGPVLRIIGASGAYAFILFLFLFAAYSVYGLPPQGEGVKTLRSLYGYSFWYLLRRVFSNLSQGLAYISQSKNLIDAITLLTGTQITLVLLGTLGPGFADKILKIDIRDASMVIVTPAILGIMVGAIWIGNVGYLLSAKKLSNIGILSAGLILMIVSALVAITNMLWFSLIPRAIVIGIALILFFLLGVANSFLDVPSNSILQKETTENMRGRVYGLLAAIVGGIGVLPVVVSGILADIIGVGKVILLLGSVVFLFGLVRVRRV